MPGLLGSASVRGGDVTLTVVNPHATLPVEAAIELGPGGVRDATAVVLAHDDITAHNTFDEPAAVAPAAPPAAWDGGGTFLFPPASVTVLRGRR
jgi:alpha-N-arabinofuranosidase